MLQFSPNSTIALVGSSDGLPRGSDAVPRLCAFLESLGLRTVVFPSLYQTAAGTPQPAERRAADIQAAFASPEVDAVFEILLNKCLIVTVHFVNSDLFNKYEPLKGNCQEKKKIWEKKMNKKKIGEKTDSLLEAEMIKEAKMIEESLLGNAANDFEISDEELDEAYQQFLKKMKAEGKLDEDKINEANSAKAMNNDTKTAEIVKFPGFRNEASKEENLKDAQSTESSAEEIDFIAGFSDKLRQFEKEENKPWYKYGKAVGIAVLAAIGILAGSMASQADSAKFVSSVQHIINSEDVMP